mmetsp:Transcript_16541/g.22674  ORF Transcript_16541/g.22674 Transcript_16541/m.22674 type:complete len:96 (-) Transcript_16541:23-310(-)
MSLCASSSSIPKLLRSDSVEWEARKKEKRKEQRFSTQLTAFLLCEMIVKNSFQIRKDTKWHFSGPRFVCSTFYLFLETKKLGLVVWRMNKSFMCF